MIRRILALAGFLVIPPFWGLLAYQLSIGGPLDPSWALSRVLPSIGGWATFWAAVAQITGYSLRDFVSGEGKWKINSGAYGRDSEGTTVKSLPANELGDHSYVKHLETELERKKELLEAIEKRLHELRLKKASLGAAFSAGEAVELREGEKDASRLRAEILRLEAQMLSEQKR